MGNPYRSLWHCKNQRMLHGYQQIFGLYQGSETSWSALLSLAVGAEIHRAYVKIFSISECTLTPTLAIIFSYIIPPALLAPDHRHGVDGGGVIYDIQQPVPACTICRRKNILAASSDTKCGYINQPHGWAAMIKTISHPAPSVVRPRLLRESKKRFCRFRQNLPRNLSSGWIAYLYALIVSSVHLSNCG